jgi:hypothetical protein
MLNTIMKESENLVEISNDLYSSVESDKIILDGDSEQQNSEEKDAPNNDSMSNQNISNICSSDKALKPISSDLSICTEAPARDPLRDGESTNESNKQKPRTDISYLKNDSSQSHEINNDLCNKENLSKVNKKSKTLRNKHKNNKKFNKRSNTSQGSKILFRIEKKKSSDSNKKSKSRKRMDYSSYNQMIPDIIDKNEIITIIDEFSKIYHQKDLTNYSKLYANLNPKILQTKKKFEGKHSNLHFIYTSRRKNNPDSINAKIRNKICNYIISRLNGCISGEEEFQKFDEKFRDSKKKKFNQTLNELKIRTILCDYRNITKLRCKKTISSDYNKELLNYLDDYPKGLNNQEEFYSILDRAFKEFIIEYRNSIQFLEDLKKITEKDGSNYLFDYLEHLDEYFIYYANTKP